MWILKWLSGTCVFLIIAYIGLLVINGIIIDMKYKRTHFPCTYIKGMCTVKPTWKVCSGGEPDDYCELRINNRL